MDIVRIRGGLGNQMFQYALAVSLREKAREVGCSLGFYRNHPEMMPFVLDKVFPHVCLNEVNDEIFNEIDNKWRKIKENSERRQNFEKDLPNRFFYVEEDAYTFYHEIYETNNCVFVGYWQSEKYFADIRERVLDEFAFKVEDYRLKKLADCLSEDYISVHIRRGDYLKLSCMQVCTKEYYQKAIAKMKELVPGAKFIFFSDDVDWVKNNFCEENMMVCTAELFEKYEDWYDMYLMTKCRGNIIANSSFSWWGAWLNQNENHLVISPSVWTYNSDTPDVWCKNWMKVDV